MFSENRSMSFSEIHVIGGPCHADDLISSQQAHLRTSGGLNHLLYGCAHGLLSHVLFPRSSPVPREFPEFFSWNGCIIYWQTRPEIYHLGSFVVSFTLTEDARWSRLTLCESESPPESVKLSLLNSIYRLMITFSHFSITYLYIGFLPSSSAREML